MGGISSCEVVVDGAVVVLVDTVVTMVEVAKSYNGKQSMMFFWSFWFCVTVIETYFLQA